MAENLNVEWAEIATEQLHQFYTNILRTFGLREADRFLNNVQEFESVIAAFPFVFIRSRRKMNLRIGLIHHHVSAIYEVKQASVIILLLIDNRSGLYVR